MKKTDTKRVFLKQGACSSAMFYILNREFGRQMDAEVRAAEPLAGGIMQQGYQCGMLWGSTLAAGAEAYRRCGSDGKATVIAINATQRIMEEFVKLTKSPDCLDITHCDWTDKLSIAKFMLTGKFLSCFSLIEKWAPQAILAAEAGLSDGHIDMQTPVLSCASEVARRMGASEEQAVMLAGFAGGMGLSGNACGALGAAVWMRTLDWQKEGVKKFSMTNPYIEKVMKAFQAETNYEFLCHKITGRQFKTISEHSEFIRNGGCEKVMRVLAGV